MFSFSLDSVFVYFGVLFDFVVFDFVSLVLSKTLARKSIFKTLCLVSGRETLTRFIRLQLCRVTELMCEQVHGASRGPAAVAWHQLHVSLLLAAAAAAAGDVTGTEDVDTQR